MPLHHSKRPEDLFRKIQRLKKDIPRIAGNLAVRHFKQSFREQGWKDKTLDKWAARKRKTGRNTDKRAILVKSGALRRSIRIIRYTKNSVIVSSELPYAIAHNEGAEIQGTQNVRTHQRRTRSGSTTVRRHSREVNFKIPKRKFMGQSDTLDDMIVKDIESRLRQILR